MRKMMCAAMMCALLTPAGQAVSAPQYDIRTGDDLNKSCADPSGAVITPAERERLLVCGAYIRGYLAYYSVSRDMTQGKGFCLPDGGVAADKLRLLYIGVLAKKPQIRDYPAAVDLASILQAAYPCKAGAAR